MPPTGGLGGNTALMDDDHLGWVDTVMTFV
jgi:hypothetical protein